MRLFPPIAAAAAVAVFGLCLAGPPAEAQKQGGAAAEPQRGTEERPFGGPPPNSRSLRPKKQGMICRTAVGTCQLDKAGTPGAACGCPAGGGAPTAGKVE